MGLWKVGTGKQGGCAILNGANVTLSLPILPMVKRSGLLRINAKLPNQVFPHLASSQLQCAIKANLSYPLPSPSFPVLNDFIEDLDYSRPSTVNQRLDMPIVRVVVKDTDPVLMFLGEIARGREYTEGAADINMEEFKESCCSVPGR
jgi:hypothetical protein